ncbi:hypothetical protein AVEN_26326-1 [Araneus ventricosus]|uniref:Uncharacterized protein n=1 Tax=Araneus ventricosus TaxID=182803 RepID=A0A4Y2AN37_ARAVE|nr:hypothetical protein AVEN_26326-1 [Araneus ventricosus]
MTIHIPDYSLSLEVHAGSPTETNSMASITPSPAQMFLSLFTSRHLAVDRNSCVEVGSLICDAWNKSATVGNATRGFKVTGIFPFKNNAFPDELFFALAGSEVPVPENTTQEEANSSSEVLINTPQINLQPAEPETSSVKPPSPTKHLRKISPIPRLSQVTAKHRIKKTAVLLTSIDNRNALKANLEK